MQTAVSFGRLLPCAMLRGVMDHFLLQDSSLVGGGPFWVRFFKPKWFTSLDVSKIQTSCRNFNIPQGLFPGVLLSPLSLTVATLKAGRGNSQFSSRDPCRPEIFPPGTPPIL